MRLSADHLEKARVTHPLAGRGKGFNGMFKIQSPVSAQRKMIVLSSDGLDWDHVSVSMYSPKGKCPNWDEMSHVKELFFKDDETVVQFHPKKSEHVNNHNSCLHLWRKQEGEHELPPSIMTGIKEL